MYFLAAVYSLVEISIASARTKDRDSDQKLRQNDLMCSFPTNLTPPSRVTHEIPLLYHPVRAPAQDLRLRSVKRPRLLLSSTLQRTSPWSRKLDERRCFQITVHLIRWVCQRPQTGIRVFFWGSRSLPFMKKKLFTKRQKKRRNQISGFWIFSYLNLGISAGSPTLMKNLAKACARCSLYGGNKRSRFPEKPWNSDEKNRCGGTGFYTRLGERSSSNWWSIFISLMPAMISWTDLTPLSQKYIFWSIVLSIASFSSNRPLRSACPTLHWGLYRSPSDAFCS